MWKSERGGELDTIDCGRCAVCACLGTNREATTHPSHLSPSVELTRKNEHKRNTHSSDFNKRKASGKWLIGHTRRRLDAAGNEAATAVKGARMRLGKNVPSMIKKGETVI
jgi:hypothetical protein